MPAARATRANIHSARLPANIPRVVVVFVKSALNRSLKSISFARRADNTPANESGVLRGIHKSRGCQSHVSRQQYPLCRSES